MSEELKPHREPSPEELEAYHNMGLKDIVRLVLCLLIGEELRNRLASLLPKADGHCVS